MPIAGSEDPRNDEILIGLPGEGREIVLLGWLLWLGSGQANRLIILD